MIGPADGDIWDIGERVGGDWIETQAPEDQIAVSADNYVIDGHHTWAAALARDYLKSGLEDNPSTPPKGLQMPVTKIGLPIKDILPVLANSNTTKYKDLEGKDVAKPTSEDVKNRILQVEQERQQQQPVQPSQQTNASSGVKMKLAKTASGKTKLKLSKRDWQSIGIKTGWMKKISLNIKMDQENYAGDEGGESFINGLLSLGWKLTNDSNVSIFRKFISYHPDKTLISPHGTTVEFDTSSDGASVIGAISASGVHADNTQIEEMSRANRDANVFHNTFSNWQPESQQLQTPINDDLSPSLACMKGNLKSGQRKGAIMKVIKTADGKQKLKLTKSEWEKMGRKAGWDEHLNVLSSWKEGELVIYGRPGDLDYGAGNIYRVIKVENVNENNTSFQMLTIENVQTGELIDEVLGENVESANKQDPPGI